ncbi:MAG: hypothetical protein FJ091_18750 [Deltaproteobacteria bacterium]|nr:hypothetical protein [Deltaproteobacteria bacterium]
MANTARMSMQKRAREQKKAEKAALKREQKREKKDERASEVASADDLAAYGAAPAPSDAQKRGA